MSVVIESAITAFHKAVVKPADQPVLACLRKYQHVLFADLAATLSELPRAPDLLVHGEAIGQRGGRNTWTGLCRESVARYATSETNVAHGARLRSAEGA